MNDQLKQVIALQDRDLELDKLRAEAAAIPAKMNELKKQIQDLKSSLENSKRELTQLQLAKKQKDLDLDAQETAIRKHSTDLNAVKSNDAYRTLLGEIDKAKKEKSALEDQILQIMEQIDAASRTWKERESTAKNSEGDLLRQIGDWENKQKALEAEVAEKQSARDESVAGISKSIGEQYKRLRDNKRGAVIVPIRHEQCSGCHMRVSQNLINESRRGLKVMFCESCARIVYLEEAATAAPSPKVETP